MSAGLKHEILQDSPGKRICVLGNLAIVRGGLEAGVQFYSCYPGTPSSEIGDTFARIAREADVLFEYSTNEKVAVEVAFAAALAGARSMCGMKHLGLSYACDPISTMPYVGVEGGMVIVSAGDPSLITSPNEQDQRHFSRFLYLPVFDPATPEDARKMTRYAFGLSEETHLPVIMRPTTRVCHSSGIVELGPLPAGRNETGFKKNPSRYVPIPTNARPMRKELIKRFARAQELLRTSEFFPRVGSGKRGIVASGVAYAYARQVLEDLDLFGEVTLQQIGAYPIPEEVMVDFLRAVDSVLVVEELTPFVEECVSLCAFRNNRHIPVLGKHSGHFPEAYEYSPDLVEDSVRDYLELERRPGESVTVPDLPPRPPVLCPGCPHRASFYMVRKVFGKRTVYCNDIGCYTLGYGEPLHSCDMLLCMGSSITQASGIARITGKRTVAYIGDSTFFHSGLPALANAVQAEDNITVVILDNYITAMTGFQPSLTTPAKGATGGMRAASEIPVEDVPRFSIEQAVRGLGVEAVFSANPFDAGAMRAALKEAKGCTGVNVVICHAPCVVYSRRLTRGKKPHPFVVSQEECDGCSLCIRILGCPGILLEDGVYTIDRDMCDGCALCADVCKHNAIQQMVAERV
ncbi:MAG: indolepyruvate ferredoxin oxidoreductase subunit alpha [Planctomycetota bacterium]|jgi:indolepyruvate ferredoxin oxidoreductase alpha subunit